MDSKQKFLEIRKIFNDVIESEVRKYFDQSNKEESKITFFNIKGDMFFLNKYELIGDGDGGNEVMYQINGNNFTHSAPTFIIHGERYDFWLHLERADIERDDRSYFIKENRKKENVYRLDCEDMLKSKEFTACIIQMIKDVAPERLNEVRQMLY